ncbi:MAG: hypothetical protein IJ309_02415 [Clostridia bacterium]|nr:hypothetical protein [Clostridia bacterium]
MTDKKVEHHVDTLYYVVCIEDDKTNNDDAGMVALVNELNKLKAQKMENPSEVIDFCGLEVHPASFSIYQYHLQLKESFDIFIANNIQNENTPRICVQLRTRLLVYEGEFKAIEKSFEYVQAIADSFGLKIGSVFENRIDYAFHTNLMQKSTEYLNTEYLCKHTKTKLVDFSMHGKIKKFEVNTLHLGKRGSNSLFVRIYKKSREVIEQGYKSFFIERWYDKGIINKYDRYVYRRAYELKSYVAGTLVGRCEWYIQYGKDDEIKKMLKGLIAKCYANSDNAPHLEKKIKGLLPPVTVVTNVEFQTKRKFYQSCDKFIAEQEFNFKGLSVLKRLYKILFLKKEFCNYLTERVLSFVDNKGTKREIMVDWWRRIHSCKMRFTDPAILDLYRTYERNSDLARVKKGLLTSIARYAVLKNDCEDPSSLHEDVCDMLADINDNDINDMDEQLKNGKLPVMRNYQYPIIQRRAARSLRGVVKK